MKKRRKSKRPPQIRKKIFLIKFTNGHSLVSTFLRFQEYYESPRFRGKIFTWQQFMNWYAKKNKGEFTYFQDWGGDTGGFNIPSKILEPFFDGEFDPLTQREQSLVNRFIEIRGQEFYVVGILGNDLDLLRHEVLHGFFYTRPEYRKAVVRTLKRHGTYKIKRALTKRGYHSSVFNDEINAYVLTDIEGLDGVMKSEIRRLRKALEGVFEKHFGVSFARFNRGFMRKYVREIVL